MARTEQESGREGKSGKFVSAYETSLELAEWRRLQRKNLKKLSPQNRKERLQHHSVSSWQRYRSLICQKKGKSHQFNH